MHRINTHICTLPKEPQCVKLAPTASRWRRLGCWLRHLTLAGAWHRGAACSLRSRANLAADRQRQLADARLLLHPYSPLAFGWQCFITVLYATMLTYTPILSFVQAKSYEFDRFLGFTNIMAVADIIFNFRTGYEDFDSQEIVMESKKIAKHYAKNKLVFDFFGSLPIAAYYEYAGRLNSDNNAHRLIGQLCLVFKAFRFVTLHQYWTIIHQHLQLPYATVVITTSIAQTFYFLHWLNYFFFEFPTIVPSMKQSLNRTHSCSKFRNVNESTQAPLEVYVTNLYFVTTLAIGAGSSDPVHDIDCLDEMLLQSFISVVGLVFFSYTLMALLRLGMHANYQVYSFNGKLQELKQFMSDLHLPSYLQNKILLHVYHKYSGHYYDEASIMNTLSHQVKQDIHRFCCNDLISNASLFQDTPKAFVKSVIYNLQLQVYLPGEFLVQHGQTSDSMYFISTGTASVTSPSGREEAHLVDGANFGEASLLRPGRQMAVSIVALEICEVYRLDFKDFQYCLKMYPVLRRRLEERVLRKYSGYIYTRPAKI